jgi:hypothetical protein
MIPIIYLVALTVGVSIYCLDGSTENILAIRVSFVDCGLQPLL